MLVEAFSRMPEVFDHKTLLLGRDYYDQGKVLNIRLSEGLLKARVKGKSGQIYDVHMDLKTWPKDSAKCSCRYPMNCKHAAASLFVFHEREKNNKTQPGKVHNQLDDLLNHIKVTENQSLSSQSTHCLVYIIEPSQQGIEHKLLVRLALAKILKKNGLGKKIIFNQLSNSKRQHFIENDEDLVNQLMFRVDGASWFDRIAIRNSELLSKIVATGRAYFHLDADEPLKKAKPLKAECQWTMQPNGRQRLELFHEEGLLSPLLLDEPWYIDEEKNQLGKLESPYTSRQLHHWLQTPALSFQEVNDWVEKMRQTAPEFPLPLHYERQESFSITPQAFLLFDSLSLGDVSESADVTHENQKLYTLEASFAYDGVRISHEDPCEQVVKVSQGVLQQFKRDKAFEEKQMKALFQQLPARRLTDFEQRKAKPASKKALVMEEIVTDSDLNRLYQDVIPALKHQGWMIDIKSRDYEEVIDEEAIEWFSDLKETSNDFFSYRLGILVDGRAVSIVPLVVDLIAEYGSAQVLDQLPDTEWVKLQLGQAKVLRIELGRIKPLIRLLLQYGLRRLKTEDEQIEINRYQLMLMKEAELATAASKARWQGADELRQRLLQLINKEQLPDIDLPRGLKTQLRDYQYEGYKWIQFLRQYRFGGVLADDMGLGKTIQTLAHLQYEKEQGRLDKASLIIAPTSLVGNWEAEAARFTPELKVLVFHGSERHEDDFEGYDLVISTYGLIQRDKERFTKYPFYYLILDESQFIKNARTKTTQIIQQLHAKHRLCLTGTPLENHLGELWSLFHFLMPGLLGDAKQFRQWFKTPIEKHADEERRALLAHRVKPFMLRRTKNQVLKELPAKTEMTQRIQMTGKQRDLYEAIRMSMEKKVRDVIAQQGLNKSHIILLDALLKLRQICCDPKLLSLEEAKMAHGSSAKLDALMELLNNLMEENRKVLIFSQFTSMLALIEEQLKTKKYNYLKLTGQTQNRQDLVNAFQNGEAPIFLISLKAGGTGLNLTRADTVIHYDPWWNPAVEDQATDRSHRIGQENPVFVYKLITEGTVEEVILAMQERKRQLIDGVLSSSGAGLSQLTDQDIRAFFAPLD